MILEKEKNTTRFYTGIDIFISKVPPAIFYAEKAVLYRKMVLGKKYKNEVPFLDRRNQIIYKSLDDLQDFYWPGTSQLIANLEDQGKLVEAGGAAYVKSLFENLEPEEDCKDGYEF
jgi:hypothetical protein